MKTKTVKVIYRVSSIVYRGSSVGLAALVAFELLGANVELGRRPDGLLLRVTAQRLPHICPQRIIPPIAGYSGFWLLASGTGKLLFVTGMPIHESDAIRFSY